MTVSDDYTRVPLNEIEGELGSDYINASFISVSHFNALTCIVNSFLFFQGCHANKYIAAQGKP